MALSEYLFPDLDARLGLLGKKVGSQVTEARKLREDIGMLALTMMAVMDAMCRKGHLTRKDVLDSLETVDRLDGVQDGSIAPDAIRKALGVPLGRGRRTGKARAVRAATRPAKARPRKKRAPTKKIGRGDYSVHSAALPKGRQRSAAINVLKRFLGLTESAATSMVTKSGPVAVNITKTGAMALANELQKIGVGARVTRKKRSARSKKR